jgi:glycosyltransferase involved in cell wall biosynthesis
MKITILAPFKRPEKGASVVRVENFRKTFERRGHEVSIIAPHRGGSDHLRYNSKMGMLKAVLSTNPDVVIGTSTLLLDCLLCLIVCKIRGIKFILDSKEPTYITASSLGMPFYRVLYYMITEHILNKLSSHVFVLTREHKNMIKKSMIVPNTTSGIRRNTFWRRKIRKKLKVEKKFLFVYFGGSEDENLEEMMKRIPDNITVLLLLIERIKIKRKNTITIMNVDHDDIYKYLSASDAAILYWKSDLIFSIPVKVIESAAADLPVIAKGPKNGSLKNFFKQYKIGLYSSSWDGFIKNISNAKHFRADGKRVREDFGERRIEEAVSYIEKIFKV